MTGQSSRAKPKLTRIEEITSFAEANGLAFNANDVSTYSSIAHLVLDRLDCRPDDGTERIHHLSLTGNHTALYRTSYRSGARSALAELASLIRAYRLHGPAYAHGDLAGATIDRFARSALAICLGKGWRTTVSQILTRHPDGCSPNFSRRKSSDYLRVTECLGLKMINRHVMIEIELGNARLRNRHLSLPALPEAIGIALEGRTVSSIMERNPFGPDFGAATVASHQYQGIKSVLLLEGCSEQILPARAGPGPGGD